MKEKIIIKSKNYKTTNFMKKMTVIGIITFFVLLILFQLDFRISLLVGMGISLFGLIVHCIYSKIELTVTDKRIYGTAIFGRRVDLPLDSVSAVGTAWMKAITITSSSGRISFNLIKNRDELYTEIGKLLVERQNSKNEVKVETNNSADELKKFKELLDSGVITQEEFDSKKKQLLGL